MKQRSILIVTIVASIFAFHSPAKAQTLSAALDATNLTWTTGGSSPGPGMGWTGETTTTHDGISAARSYTASFNATSFLQTTVTGPGTLSFWYYLHDGDISLSFSINGVTQPSIPNGSTSWVPAMFYLGSGTQTLKWTYSNPSIAFNPAYLDQVSWVPGTTAPIITNEPPSQSQVEGLANTFTVGVLGTPPFSYQWHFNDVDIPGATSGSYTVPSVQATNLGNYSVTITNAVGSTNSTYASLEFGNVTAWGISNYSQTAVAPGASNVIEIRAGWQHSIALKADGSLLAWGGNTDGQETIPPNLTNVLAVGANTINSMALMADGRVLEWGDNFYGQTNATATLSNVVAIAPANANYTMAVLRSDGTVAVTGSSLYGQTNVPSGLTNVVAVATGNGHMLALKSDGTVVAWGGFTGSPTNIPSGLTDVVAIATSTYQALALKANGTVVAWGANAFGVTNVPPNLTNVVAIDAGTLHNLALKADGTVVAWGYNNLGQTNVPVGLSNVVAIAAGGSFNVVLVGNGPPIMSAPIQNPTLSPTGFSFSLPSQSGRVYALEYKNSLTDATWTPLPLVAGNGTNMILTDPAVGNSQRFYRVRRW